MSMRIFYGARTREHVCLPLYTYIYYSRRATNNARPPRVIIADSRRMSVCERERERESRSDSSRALSLSWSYLLTCGVGARDLTGRGASGAAGFFINYMAMRGGF